MHRLFASTPCSALQSSHTLHDITSLITGDTRQNLTFLHTSWAQVAVIARQQMIGEEDELQALPQTLICFNPLLVNGVEASKKLPQELQVQVICQNGGDAVSSAAGDHNGIRLLVTQAGHAGFLVSPQEKPRLPRSIRDTTITAVASTNAGRVAAAVIDQQTGQSRVLEFSSLGASDEDHDDSRTFWKWASGQTEPLKQHIVPDTIVQLVATRAAYAARTATGAVLSWAADARATPPHMLGCHDDSDTSRPAPVACCEGLTVTRLSGCQGGQWTAALTEAGDAFVWGGDFLDTIDVSDSGPMLVGHEADAGAVRLVLPGRCETASEDNDHLSVSDGVAGIAIGRDHIAVLDEVGGLWAWQRREPRASCCWQKVQIRCGEIREIAANEECILVIADAAQDEDDQEHQS